jgi:flagellar biogenesis protein FliO
LSPLGATIGLLALVVVLIWLVAGLMVVLGSTLGIVQWGERPED